jgi:hypothetical protein
MDMPIGEAQVLFKSHAPKKSFLVNNFFLISYVLGD